MVWTLERNQETENLIILEHLSNRSDIGQKGKFVCPNMSKMHCEEN